MKTRMLFGAAATAALAVARARRPPDDITGEVAVITGASRGLGLILARELARQGCRLVICARDSEELGHAASMLRRDGAEVTAVPADLEAAGTPELLVRTHEHGRIVNITSVGGKISVPHLLPYSVAKFAAVAFSEGLRAELGSAPIAVTTVVPGLMRTGSHLHAEFGGRPDEEFTWFSLGASLPLVSIDAERAGRQVVRAMRRRRPELIITPVAQLAARGAGVFPELTTGLLHVMARLLPSPGWGDGQVTPGHELRPAVNQPLFDRLTILGRAAARQFNQLSGRSAARPRAGQLGEYPRRTAG